MKTQEAIAKTLYNALDDLMQKLGERPAGPATESMRASFCQRYGARWQLGNGTLVRITHGTPSLVRSIGGEFSILGIPAERCASIPENEIRCIIGVSRVLDFGDRPRREGTQREEQSPGDTPATP